MKRLAWLLVLSMAVAAAATAPPARSPGKARATRYTILLMGNTAGFETSALNADGSLQLYWEYNDRGRGPKIHERMVLDGSGLPTRLESSGTDYFKGPRPRTVLSWRRESPLEEPRGGGREGGFRPAR